VRWVFAATGGFLARIESATRVAFWVDEPTEHDFDPSRLITVDLARTPSEALERRIPWDAVEVDDCYSAPNGELQGTTLGPRWPEMQLAGAVLLERRFVDRLAPALRPPCPPRLQHGRAYEHTTVLYWPNSADARAGNRYTGHHAEIIEERGTLARVRVYPPGTSDLPNRAAQTMWIDLTSPEQSDVGSEQLTEVGLGDAPKHGALFLLSGRMAPRTEP
jgi:hypothetical protein